jgi:hypothetical protein
MNARERSVRQRNGEEDGEAVPGQKVIHARWLSTMIIPMNEEFRRLCQTIASELDRDPAAVLVESDDLRQAPSFCGGWNEESKRFWLSFYAPDGGDYIFSMSIEDVRIVAAGGSMSPSLERWKDAPEW